MPRKKQTVQTKKRQKAYRPGEMTGEATRVKPKGVFKLFSNYQVFAIIGVVALAGGLILGVVLGGGSTDPDPGVERGEVIRTTPEPGATADPETGAAANIKQYPAPPPMVIDTAKTYTATIKTEKGDIVIELNDDDAPATVNNFVFLARDGFYDGVTFFRVIADEDGALHFAQAGDPTGTGSGGPGYTLPFESPAASFERGVLAMAKPNEAGAPNNGSQFFFTLQEEPTLDGKFTSFGRVTEGLEVLESLTPRDPQTQEDPEPGARIESIEISEA
jgi:cyclophilin family peptidyl-prolyl cis-trans isomerase